MKIKGEKRPRVGRPVFLLLLLAVSLASGCRGKNAGPEGNTAGGYQVYYINSEETKLVSESYKTENKGGTALAWELIARMGENPKNITYKKVLTDEIKVTNISLSQKGQLTVSFNTNYSSLQGITEILCRAAVVKTLCQMEEVSRVEFYVGDQPLMAEGSDKAIGFMSEDDFIDNTGGETNFYQNTTLSLFFADKTGSHLKEIHVDVVYDGTKSMEQVIVEMLIAGPENIANVDTGKIFPTVPKNARLLKASTKEGICYVDFNEAFLEKLPDLTDEAAVYSVVNSLVEMSSVDKVQFAINGVQVKTYRENLEFDVPLERNLDLVK